MKKLKFGEWIIGQIDEIKLGSDGSTDNQVTQTNNATAKVAQNWLSQNINQKQQADLLKSQSSKSTLAPKLMDAGTVAIKQAPNNLGNVTTAPNVANFIQTNLGLPKVIQQPKPGQVKMMRKK